MPRDEWCSRFRTWRNHLNNELGPPNRTFIGPMWSFLPSLRHFSEGGPIGIPRHQIVLSVSQDQNGDVVTNHPAPANPILYQQATPIWNELDKYNFAPLCTNYHVDFLAGKIGYLSDGSHREVFDLGVKSTRIEPRSAVVDDNGKGNTTRPRLQALRWRRPCCAEGVGNETRRAHPHRANTRYLPR